MEIGREIRTIVSEPLWTEHTAPPAPSADSAPLARRGPGDRVPDIVAPVIAWRAWHVEIEGTARLMSVTGSERWPVGRAFVAGCRRLPGRHPSPRLDCACGVHGARTARDAADHAARPDAYVVLGLVALWGEVVEAERGWRASHAYPQRLAVLPPRLSAPAEHSAVAADLGDYGVPVDIVTGWRTAITGQPVLTWTAGRAPLAWPFVDTAWSQRQSTPRKHPAHVGS